MEEESEAGGVCVGAGSDAGGSDAGGSDAGGSDAGGSDAGGSDAGGSDCGLAFSAGVTEFRVNESAVTTRTSF